MINDLRLNLKSVNNLKAMATLISNDELQGMEEGIRTFFEKNPHQV